MIPSRRIDHIFSHGYVVNSFRLRALLLKCFISFADAIFKENRYGSP